MVPGAMGEAPKRKLDTIADYLARPAHQRIELIRGTIDEKSEATAEHALAQAATSRAVGNPFQRKPGGRWPGGWWFFTELEVQLGAEILRPDVCGYRRERVSVPPRGWPVLLAPDWVCEILSPSNPQRDRVEKLQTYFKAKVPHYWIIDPVAGSLEVFRRLDLAYALVQTALRGERVRAEPFEAVELRVDELLGADPED
jgi:Uma2 family endonuclease